MTPESAGLGGAPGSRQGGVGIAVPVEEQPVDVRGGGVLEGPGRARIPSQTAAPGGGTGGRVQRPVRAELRPHHGGLRGHGEGERLGGEAHPARHGVLERTAVRTHPEVVAHAVRGVHRGSRGHTGRRRRAARLLRRGQRCARALGRQQRSVPDVSRGRGILVLGKGLVRGPTPGRCVLTRRPVAGGLVGGRGGVELGVGARRGGHHHRVRERLPHRGGDVVQQHLGGPLLGGPAREHGGLDHLGAAGDHRGGRVGAQPRGERAHL